MSRLEVLGVGLVLGMLAGLAIGSSMARGATPRSAQEQRGLPTASTVAVGATVAPERSEAPDRNPGVSPSSGPAATSELPVATVATPAPDSSPRPTRTRTPVAGNTTTGPASWYCGNGSPCTSGYAAGGLYAAAGPALRVGAWRGRYVTVNGLAVRLIDFCACPDGRVIDLYAAAFARLAPLSAGVVKVTVRW